MRELTGENLKVVLAVFSTLKLGRIAALLSKCLTRMQQALLELKTRPRVRLKFDHGQTYAYLVVAVWVTNKNSFIQIAP